VQGGYYIWDEVIIAESLSEIAVPEPSTFALMIGLMTLGGVLLRRRLRKD
jgi:hypothetical protein